MRKQLQMKLLELKVDKLVCLLHEKPASCFQIHRFLDQSWQMKQREERTEQFQLLAQLWKSSCAINLLALFVLQGKVL